MEKTFVFVEHVWSAYVDDNKPDIRHVSYIILYTCQSCLLTSERLKTRNLVTQMEKLRMAVLPDAESDDDD